MVTEKSKKNLKPRRKDTVTSEQMAEIGRLGGIKSGETRRRKAELRKAMELIMDMPARGKVKLLLAEMGYSEEEQVNSNAVAATLFSMALKGDPKALDLMINYYFQASEDDRKTKESDARINAMEKNGIDAVNSGDDDDGGVVIYLPKIEEENDEDDNGECDDGEEE